MDTALPQIFPFILDRNLAKANCTGNQVCTSCDTVVLECGPLVAVLGESCCKLSVMIINSFNYSSDVPSPAKYMVPPKVSDCQKICS